MQTFNQDHAKKAAKTARASNFTDKALVPRYIAQNVPSTASVLDYGCGKGVHVQALSFRGYKVTGHDFSSPNPKALKKQYDVVYLSNVLNTQSDLKMLAGTLDEAWGCVKKGGALIANFPLSPRYLGMDAQALKGCLEYFTRATVEVIKGMGTKQAPIFRITRAK